MPQHDVPLSSRSITRRNALLALGALGAGSLALDGCTVTKGTAPITTQGLAKKPAPGRKTNIEVYSLWGGGVGQGLVNMAKAYEASQSQVGVRVTYAPATGIGVQQKLQVAIAAGAPPDVAQIVPYETPQWSDLGIMTDLTDYLKRDGLSADNFIKPAWHDMNYKGKVWQLQWDADPNFPFFWNKDLFEKSGLDPEKPPLTIDEVDEYSKKILKKSGSNVTQIGLIPWSTYGFANSMFTWGFAFGGTFWDPEKEKVTADNEYVVKALEWMVRYAKSVGGADRVTVSPPSLQLHPFSTGNIGMAPLVATDFQLIRAAKKDMKIGAGLIPYQAPGAKKPGVGAWVGGWSVFIPAGSKKKDAAWDFIKWMSASEAGTAAQWKDIGFLPTYLGKALESVKTNKEMSPFYDTLFATESVRPNIPVADFFAESMETEVSKAIYGQATALQALRTINHDTQRELDRFKREVRS
ncbi:MAG TPA: ABC transporter substrate-binding protein [Mycobacteriales bacterium]|jgi:multiple sugar transport system substrate-binding protein|nr:ABC transporter substrate-binding protein [Mycobacteriales bacterium]